MFERLSDRARKIFALANEEAKRLHHGYIVPEHILLGLIGEGKGVGATVLSNLGVNLNAVRIEVEQALNFEANQTGSEPPQHTSRAKKVIERAIEEVQRMSHSYVGTEHILLGLLQDVNGVGCMTLLKHGVTIDNARQEIVSILALGKLDAEPFERPMKLSVIPKRYDPTMATLADERGNVVSEAMRIELAEEIVKRYNAQLCGPH